MKFDIRSTTDDIKLFSMVDQTLETAVANARNSAMLHGIDPDTIRVDTADDPDVSSELDRYGEEWFVSSEDYSAASPYRR